MSKKVLIISGSPRIGGNSDTLCDEFARGAGEAGHNVEKISLAGKKITFCDDCGECAENKRCVHEDDVPAMIDSMMTADVIVLATPVYFYTMDAQLKALIDRTSVGYNDIAGKDFYFIATAADTDEEKLMLTIQTLRGFTDWCLPDAHEKGYILAGGVWKSGEILGHPAIQQAYEMGKAV